MGLNEILNFNLPDTSKWFSELWNIPTEETTKTKSKIKDLIVLAYMPLTKQIAYSLARRSNDPVEDIMQVGSIGLMKAINNYRPEYGASFKTYATYFIVGEIRHYLRDKAKLVRVPREVYELSYRINSFIKDLTEKLGNPPTEEEIAAEMNITPMQVQEARTVERRTTPISSDAVAGDDSDIPISLEEKIPVEDYEEAFDNFLNRIMLKEAFKVLTPLESQIINLNFFEGLSQAEISRELKMSKMQVSRTIKKALKKMFDYITEKES